MGYCLYVFTIASETQTARICSNACWNFVQWQLSTTGQSSSRSTALARWRFGNASEES